MALALVFSAAPFASGDAAAPAATATLAPAVTAFLEDADAGTMTVIVTFHDEAGFARLADLGVTPVDRLRAVPMALVTLTADEVRAVASWDVTRSVWDNEELELYLDEGTRMVNAHKVWAGEHLDRAYTGAGVGVVVADTGIDATHPDLPYGVKVKANYYVAGNFLGPEPADTEFTESVHTDTEHGHGTHVAGTIAGTGAASNGEFKGVAPGADVYGFKIGTGASVWTWWAARTFDWVLEHGEAHNIRVISNSWGGGSGEDYNPDNPIDVLAKALYDEDVLVVFSAGNAGGPDKLNRYAVSPWVVSVGAVNKDFTKASFSSTGRPGGDGVRDADGLYRPTVMAPGVDINAARSSAGVVMSTGTDAENPYYTAASGTSMSAPHVSGIIALMLEARPTLSAADVIAILEGTAADMPAYEHWEVGAGMVDAHAAVIAAEKGKTQFPPSTNGKTPAYTLREGHAWQGTVAPAGYVLKDASDATIHAVPVEVGDGVDALFAEISWDTPENVYLFLHDPQGNEVASSAGLLDVGRVTHRTVVVTNPEPGMWTLTVEGRVNAVTDYTGFHGTYDENVQKKEKKNTRTVTNVTPFTGLVGPSVDAVHDSQWHPIDVPEGATEVRVRLDWADPTWDVDLFVYDSRGNLVGQSTQGSTNWEETTITTGDVMTGAIAPGEWTIEVRGWLTVATEYEGTAHVTHVP